jgi:hypothetical protein
VDERQRQWKIQLEQGCTIRVALANDDAVWLEIWPETNPFLGIRLSLDEADELGKTIVRMVAES